MTVERKHGAHYSYGSEEILNLRDMDVVWMRQDPPFDMGYITATHLLELISDDTLVLNNPTEVRERAGKTVCHQIPGFDASDPHYAQ